MDTTAHRIIKQARDLLVDGLGLYRIDVFPREPLHGMDATQRAQVVEATELLWRLLSDDPSPPECQECATPITQPKTGRPRLYCSDACRSASARARR